MKGRGCLERYRNFHFTRILLHFANSLRIILTFLGSHCGVGLQLIEETRWQFSCEYSQLFIHKLCAFLAILITSNFSFSRLFAFITSAPTLEKFWLRP